MRDFPGAAGATVKKIVLDGKATVVEKSHAGTVDFQSSRFRVDARCSAIVDELRAERNFPAPCVRCTGAAVSIA